MNFKQLSVIVGNLVLYPLLLLALWIPTGCAADLAVRDLLVNVRINPEAQELMGRAQIRLNPAADDEVQFYLFPRAQLLKVTVNGRNAEYSIRRGILTILLPSGDSGQSIEVQYLCRFDDPLPSSFISHENPSFGVRSVISGAGVFLDKGAGWYPHPLNGVERLTVEVSATAGVEAITEGERILHRSDDTGTVSGWSVASPTGPISLSAGRYRITERRHGNLSLYTYFTPINTDLAERYLDLVAQYLDLYEGLFGPYPSSKFAIVENFLPTGFGYKSYTLLGSGLLRQQAIMYATLPHEIAHCWWGNSVMPDYDKGNWSEGLVTYLAEHLLAERRSASEARLYRYKLISDYAALVNPDKEFALRDFSSRSDPVSRSIGYGKGAMVFHMIRTTVGDQAFFATLRSLAQEKRDTKVDWDELIAAFEKTLGISLEARAKLWLDKTGGSRLEAKDLELKRHGAIWELSGAIIVDRPDYQAAVKLAFVTDRSEKIHTVTVRGKRNEFRIRSNEMPVRLRLDPDNDLFRVIGREELPATVNRIKGAEELTVITADGWNYDENLKLLIESLGKSDVTYMTEADIGEKLPATDILFYGYPSAKSISGSLPQGVSIRKKEFEVVGNRFNKSEDLLFMVFPNPSDRNKVIAVCFPLSEYAARSAVPKITHYGRSGYLVFSSGVNKVMGLFQGSNGGLTYRITQQSVE